MAASKRRSSSRTRSTTASPTGQRSSSSSSGEEASMSLETITVDISARRVATVTLNRPDRGNAFNQTLLDELGDALKGLAADDTVRVAVLRGAGKHFCTGADLASRGPSALSPPPQPAKYALREVL